MHHTVSHVALVGSDDTTNTDLNIDGADTEVGDITQASITAYHWWSDEQQG